MQSYSPELIQTMRAALDEVMTKIPLEQATPGIKAAVAECILKAAANGQRHGSCELGPEGAIGTKAQAICITSLSVSYWL